MRLSILALEGLFDTGLTVLLDTFAMANELAAAQGFAAPPFDVGVVGVRRRVRTAHGLSMLAEPASSARHADWVVVPAPGIRQPERLIEALEQLRAQWHGYRIAVHVSEHAPGPGIDTPEDLARVRALFAA